MNLSRTASNDEDNQSTVATRGEDDVDRLDFEDNQQDSTDPPSVYGPLQNHDTQIDIDAENWQENNVPITLNLTAGSPERQDGQDGDGEDIENVDAFDIEDELIENENGELSWIDSFEVTNFKHSRQQVRQLGPSHRWKGADWTLYLVHEQGHQFNRAGIFIGFENPSRLPKGFSIKAKYWIHEYDHENPNWAGWCHYNTISYKFSNFSLSY